MVVAVLLSPLNLLTVLIAVPVGVDARHQPPRTKSRSAAVRSTTRPTVGVATAAAIVRCVVVIEGMPIQVTQNVATAKGIANGTLGTLESVHYPDGTRFRLVHDGATNTVVQLPSRAPDYAMLRVLRPRASAIRPGVDPDLFPVFYATDAYREMTITLLRAPDGSPRAITVKPQQLPFVCAVGSTVYKVHGETLHAMVVMDWRSKHHVVNKPQ